MADWLHVYNAKPIWYQLTPVAWLRRVVRMISFFSGWKKMIKDLEGDKGHVLILFFLYCLQGIPLGLVNNLKFLMRLNLLWKLG